MKDNIIQIFDGIDKKELKSLHDYVNSPFFNKSRRLSDFYELVYKNFDVYKANGLTKKDLAKKLYPGETYSKKTDENIRKLLSDFGKLLDSYMVTTKFLQDEDNSAITLVKTLRERGMEDKFKKKLSDLKKKQEKVKYRDEKYYKLESELIEEEWNANFSKNMLIYSDLEQKASDNFDFTFILNKLKIFMVMWTKQFYNKNPLNYNKSFFNDINSFIEKNINIISCYHPELYIQYLTNLMFHYNDKNSFDTLKSYLEENTQNLPSNIYNSYSWKLINFLVSQINSGNVEFKVEVINLLKSLDKSSNLLKNGILLPNEFKICTDYAFSVKDLEWAEYFINKYKGKIKEDYSYGLTNLSFAKLYFYQKNFSRAKDFQSKINYKDYVHYFDAKMLLAKIEFETNNYDNVISVIETLKKFLKSHPELPDLYRETYKKFSIDIIRLINLYENLFLGKCNHTDIDFFYDEFNKDSGFTYSKDWFLEKLTKLKKESELVS